MELSSLIVNCMLYLCTVKFLIGNVIQDDNVTFAELVHRLNFSKLHSDLKYTPAHERTSNYWIDQAEKELKRRLKLNSGNSRDLAKNIIIFLGDGMSVSTLTAARILKGQRAGQAGEETTLSIDNFPFSGLVKTYCTNAQTADSACSATALFCGVKTNHHMLGVNAYMSYNNCTANANMSNYVDSLALWAQNSGKSTGIVTTTTLTNASPAALYAHTSNRFWECDADMWRLGVEPKPGCQDIALQLMEHAPGKNFDVLLGGGMSKFVPNSTLDAFGKLGERLDARNLIEQWLKARDDDAKFVTTREELLNVNVTATNQLLGTFHTHHLEFHIDAEREKSTQPTLEQMTSTAIGILQKNPKGYFLFVEGGLIDHAHHFTKAGYALDETLEFDKAIKVALTLSDIENTLILVTADHGHSLSIAGDPPRGAPILGLNPVDRDMNNLPYTTLNYAVGIKTYLDSRGRRLNLTGKMNEMSFTPSYVKSKKGVHSGEDVAIFANGPQAHLFSGIMEQNLIPHLVAFAAGIKN